MGLQNHIRRALKYDGFDLEHLELEFVPNDFHTIFEINTTDKETIEAIVSCLFTEVLTVGVTVERFSGIDSATILVNENVKFGVIDEMNVHELDNDIDMPLEQCPVFMMKIGDTDYTAPAD